MNSARLREMHRILALGCCALSLMFGYGAVAAHWHELADHHPGSQGLHFGHVHLTDPTDHEHEHHLRHEPSHNRDTHFDVRHGHHHGDLVYLSTTAVRPLDSKHRSTHATVSVSATIDPAAAMSHCHAATPDQPGDPQQESPTRPRAPPA